MGKDVDLEALRARAGEVDGLAFLPDDLRARALRAAGTRTPLLLTGETGTGKGHLARALAAASAYPNLLEVNCAALPDELLGSELFGHKKGAFTGAVADRKGLLLAARGKSLLLDEIGEVSLRMQRMLLRALERSRPTVKPLGSDEEIPLKEIRFLFATNRDLRADAHEGSFREDLLRRIEIVRIHIPPLRQRPDLLPSFLGRALVDLEVSTGLAAASMTQEAYEALLARPWRGNVRELKNVLEYALVTGERKNGGIRIDLADLPTEKEGSSTPAGGRAGEDLEGAIRSHVERILRAAGGNAEEAARRLGLASKAAFYRKIRKLGISPLRRRMNPIDL